MHTRMPGGDPRDPNESFDYTTFTINPAWLAGNLAPILESAGEEILRNPHLNKDFVTTFIRAILMSFNPERFAYIYNGIKIHNDKLSRNDSLRLEMANLLTDILVDIVMTQLETLDRNDPQYKEARIRNSNAKNDLKSRVISKLSEANPNFPKSPNKAEESLEKIMEHLYYVLAVANYILGGELPERTENTIDDNLQEIVLTDQNVSNLRELFFNKSSANKSGNSLENLIPTHIMMGMRYKGLLE